MSIFSRDFICSSLKDGFSSTSISSKSNILSLADIPFIATWNSEPKSLIGKKNSALKSIIINNPPGVIIPLLNWLIAINIPTADPP